MSTPKQANTQNEFPDLDGLKIAITGGTGFVGGHPLPKLLDLKAQVTCLVRATSNLSRLPKNVKSVVCDLTTGEGLQEALTGQDVLIHMAALLFGFGFRHYLSSNNQAAQQIAKALDDLGSLAPKKLILLSSLAAAGPSASPQGLGENALPSPVSAYGFSKLLVERTLKSSFHGQLVILRPGIIYGSGDRGLLPMFQGVKHGFAVSPGSMREFPVSCIHASDMATAIILALQEKAFGIYHVSDGKRYTMTEFCKSMGQALGRPNTKVWHLPLPIMAFSAACSSLAGNILKFITQNPLMRAPNWNFDKYREAKASGWVCDNSRLKNELGFCPKFSLQAGLEESVKGYRQRGWL